MYVTPPENWVLVDLGEFGKWLKDQPNDYMRSDCGYFYQWRHNHEKFAYVFMDGSIMVDPKIMKA